MKLFGREIHLSLGRRPHPEEMVCFGCGCDGESAAKLIAGPQVFICDRCVEAAALALAPAAGGAGPGVRLERAAGRRCSFCNAAGAVATAGGEAGICRSCVGICREIIAEDRLLAAPPPPPPG